MSAHSDWTLFMCFPAGGRNGYGAKLCNIFSTKFTVETACKEYKRSFKQVHVCDVNVEDVPPDC